MKRQVPYPVIDVAKTGQNIRLLREQAGLSINDVREFMGFNDPQAIYQWQRGVCLPSVDHLCALSKLLDVSMDDILVLSSPIRDGKQVAAHSTRKHISHIFLQQFLHAA